MAHVFAMKRARVDEVELAYQVHSSGEPVVLIHGSNVAAEFLPLVREPALRGYALLRYHRRGMGGSSRTGPASIQQQAADCAGLLAHLGVQAAHVVGRSYGGPIALQLALDAPAHVHTLALLEPALFMVPSAAAFFEQLAPVAETYRRGDTVTAVDMFLQGVGRPNAREIIERAVPGGFEQAVRDADTFFQVELPAIQAWTFTHEDARRITQPVLFVQGAESLPMMNEVRELVHAWLPQTQDVLVPGASHFLQLENAPAVAGGSRPSSRHTPPLPRPGPERASATTWRAAPSRATRVRSCVAAVWPACWAVGTAGGRWVCPRRNGWWISRQTSAGSCSGWFVEARRRRDS